MDIRQQRLTEAKAVRRFAVLVFLLVFLCGILATVCVAVIHYWIEDLTHVEPSDPYDGLRVADLVDYRDEILAVTMEDDVTLGPESVSLISTFESTAQAILVRLQANTSLAAGVIELPWWREYMLSVGQFCHGFRVFGYIDHEDLQEYFQDGLAEAGVDVLRRIEALEQDLQSNEAVESKKRPMPAGQSGQSE